MMRNSFNVKGHTRITVASNYAVIVRSYLRTSKLIENLYIKK
jgi:hypothetical protein